MNINTSATIIKKNISTFTKYLCQYFSSTFILAAK